MVFLRSMSFANFQSEQGICRFALATLHKELVLIAAPTVVYDTTQPYDIAGALARSRAVS